MFFTFKKDHVSTSNRIFSLFISFTFIFSSIGPSIVQAQLIPTPALMPMVGSMVQVSAGYAPAIVRGITIHPQNPLKFTFLVDLGDSGLSAESKELKEESQRLINYFMAGLTVPEDELWVNLSPYEQDRVIPDSVGVTAMGRDLLAQDYLLKQLTASLMYPEDELGNAFWTRVQDRAEELYGSREVPTNVFNKIWITPESAKIYIHEQNVFLTESKLKVMLEEDYLAARAEQGADVSHLETSGDLVSAEEVSAVIREVLLPEIEYEVNHGENFATLRQIFNSVILASWYKTNLKESLLGKVYVDQNKLKGIDDNDRETNEAIYAQYVEAFEKGAYNYIKEEYDPQVQEMVAKKYFSGGVDNANLSEVVDAASIGKLGEQLPRNDERALVSAIGSLPDFAEVEVSLLENMADQASLDAASITPVVGRMDVTASLVLQIIQSSVMLSDKLNEGLPQKELSELISTELEKINPEGSFRYKDIRIAISTLVSKKILVQARADLPSDQLFGKGVQIIKFASEFEDSSLQAARLETDLASLSRMFGSIITPNELVLINTKARGADSEDQVRQQLRYAMYRNLSIFISETNILREGTDVELIVIEKQVMKFKYNRRSYQLAFGEGRFSLSQKADQDDDTTAAMDVELDGRTIYFLEEMALTLSNWKNDQIKINEELALEQTRIKASFLDSSSVDKAVLKGEYKATYDFIHEDFFPKDERQVEMFDNIMTRIKGHLEKIQSNRAQKPDSTAKGRRVIVNKGDHPFNEDDPEDGSEDVEVGIVAMAANPVHWGHLETGFRAMAEHKIDQIIVIVQGDDYRKPILSKTENARNEQMGLLEKVYGGLIISSDWSKGNQNIGEQSMPEMILRNIEAGRKGKVTWHYVVGSDHGHWFAPDGKVKETVKVDGKDIKGVRTQPKELALGKYDPDTLQRLVTWRNDNQDKIAGKAEVKIALNIREDADGVLMDVEKEIVEQAKEEGSVYYVEGRNLPGTSSTKLRKVLAGQLPREEATFLSKTVYDYIMGNGEYRGLITELPQAVRRIADGLAEGNEGNEFTDEIDQLNRWLKNERDLNSNSISANSFYAMFFKGINRDKTNEDGEVVQVAEPELFVSQGVVRDIFRSSSVGADKVIEAAQVDAASFSSIQEILAASKVGEVLHQVLDGDSLSAVDFLKGGYQQSGYGVAAGASEGTVVLNEYEGNHKLVASAYGVIENAVAVSGDLNAWGLSRGIPRIMLNEMLKVYVIGVSDEERDMIISMMIASQLLAYKSLDSADQELLVFGPKATSDDAALEGMQEGSILDRLLEKDSKIQAYLTKILSEDRDLPAFSGTKAVVDRFIGDLLADGVSEARILGMSDVEVQQFRNIVTMSFSSVVRVRDVELPIAKVKLMRELNPVATLEELGPVSDAAVIERVERVGGIDLNPKLLDLQIKRDGSGIPLPMNFQPLENMNIEGFLPVIINVTPIANLPLLLGLLDNEESPFKSAKADIGDLSYLEPRDRIVGKLIG
ncbi:MAG: hypothetical protein ACI9E5_000608 [Candidatus Omnitrophota bacterium]|jgi:hypothetical protein